MFCYKDKFPLRCRSRVVYHIQCEACGPRVAYVGKTVDTLYERFYGSNGHLHPSTKSSALLEHLSQGIDPKCEFEARGGVEGLKMPYFDFSICYRAGRDEPNAKNRRLI